MATTEVTVGGFVGTGLELFSFDAPVASRAALRMLADAWGGPKDASKVQTRTNGITADDVAKVCSAACIRKLGSSPAFPVENMQPVDDAVPGQSFHYDQWEPWLGFGRATPRYSTGFSRVVQRCQRLRRTRSSSGALFP